MAQLIKLIQENKNLKNTLKQYQEVYGYSQPKKDDLAHMSGMMAIHSTTYIASNVLIDGWGKEWIPFVVGNGVGFTKEYFS